MRTKGGREKTNNGADNLAESYKIRLEAWGGIFQFLSRALYHSGYELCVIINVCEARELNDFYLKSVNFNVAHNKNVRSIMWCILTQQRTVSFPPTPQ